MTSRKIHFPIRLSFWQLFVFHLFWSILSVSSLEIWSIYFDERIELIKTTDRIIQQLIDIPFENERFIIEIKSFIDQIDRINRMELTLCEMITEDSFYNHYAKDSIFLNANDTKFVCLQRISSIQRPGIENQTIIRYPEGVGFPLGKFKQTKNNPLQAILLTIEYLEDFDKFDDNSGFDLYMAETELEKIYAEAGILAVGFVPDYRFFLPPKLNHWSLKGVCMSSCLENKMFSDVRIVGVIPSINHRFLEEMTIEINDRINHKTREIFSYSPVDNGGLHKTIEIFEEPLVNMRDRITVQCNYITSPNKTIMGGFGSDSENCIAWIHYYPKISDFDACLSSYSLTTIMSILDLHDFNVNINRSTRMDMKIKQEQMSNYLQDKDENDKWNMDKLIRAKYSAMKGRQISQCGWDPINVELMRRRKRKR